MKGSLPSLRDAARFVRSPRREGSIWRDYVSTRRSVSFLRHIDVDNPRGYALMVLLAESVYPIKLQLVEATALRLEGWKPIVLTESPRSRHVIRYCAAFGIPDVVPFDRFSLTDQDRAHCTEAAQAFLTQELRFQDVKSWEFHGARIGPQILSSVSRKQMAGAPDPRDPETRAEIEAFLLVAMATVIRTEKLVETLPRPLVATVIEANYAMFGPIVDVLVRSGVDVIQSAQPFQDDALMSKRLTPETRRHHPASLSESSLDRLLEQPWTVDRDAALRQIMRERYEGKWLLQQRNQPKEPLWDWERVKSEMALDVTKPTAVVFVHILWDANLFYGEDLFEDYGDWFIQTLQAAGENPSVNWLVKLHPANKWKRAYEKRENPYSEVQLIDKHVGPLPKHVALLFPEAPVSTLALMQGADYGVTVRGTIGIEMPTMGKRVFTAGTGRYSGLGFTTDSHSREEYLARLGSIQTYEPLKDEEVHRARVHALGLFKFRHWTLKSFRPVFNFPEEGSHPLEANVVPVVDSLSEIESNGDLHRWAAWVTESSDVDYLEIPPPKGGRVPFAS